MDKKYIQKSITVKILNVNTGLIQYENVKFIRIKSKYYNLMIMQDYLPIIGEIDGRIDIRNEEINLSYKHIQAFYMNSNNIFILMIKELIEE